MLIKLVSNIYVVTVLVVILGFRSPYSAEAMDKNYMPVQFLIQFLIISC